MPLAGPRTGAGRAARGSLALALLTAAALPVVLALPAPGDGLAAPRPVPPVVSTLPVRPEPGATVPLASGSTGTGPRRTAAYRAVGVTWSPGTDPSAVEVRTRTATGWSPWRSLDVETEGETVPGAPAGRGGTDLLWTDRADGVDVRVRGAGGRLPAGLRVELVDPGTSPADARGAGRPGTAYGAPSGPAVLSRSDWGADESIRRCRPSYSSTVKAVVVHHTASGNGYTAAEAPAVVRSIYAYHVKSRGWCDVGYNVLVDRYGVAYEGRAGGLDRPVVGAHAGGFNTDTSGISVIGDYTSATPPQAALDTVARWTAWKLAQHHRDPRGTATLTSAGGGTARYPAGRRVELPVVLGHRDVGETSCPGQQVYTRLPALRDAVAAELGPALVDPSLSSRSVETGAGPVTVTAGATTNLRWQLDVFAPPAAASPTPTATATPTPAASSGGSDDAPLRRYAGTAERGAPLSQAWDLTDATGAPVPPGRYRLRLSAAADGSHALPWETTVEVRAPGADPAPAPTATGGPAPAPGSTPVPAGTPTPRPTDSPAASPPPVGGSGTTAVAPLRVLDTRTGVGGHRGTVDAGGTVTVPVLGRGGVPSSGVDAVVLNVVATATSPTDVVLHGAGAVTPAATTLAVARRGTTQVLTTVRVGADGAVAVRNAAGSVHVAADVVGYASRGGDAYTPVTASRLLDTRRTGGALAARSSRVVRVTGRAGVPAAARTVLLDVTLLGAAGPTHASVWPSGGPRTGAWAVSTPVAGASAVNRVLARLGTDGAVVVTAGAARTHVLVDVVGWHGPGATARLRAQDPSRLADTRTGTGTRRAPLAPGETRVLPVAGHAGVPSTGARAVVLALNASGVNAVSALTVWPAGARPVPADLLTAPGRPWSGLVVVPLARDGSVRLHHAAGWAHLTVDVLGWYGG